MHHLKMKDYSWDWRTKRKDGNPRDWKHFFRKRGLISCLGWHSKLWKLLLRCFWTISENLPPCRQGLRYCHVDVVGNPPSQCLLLIGERFFKPFWKWRPKRKIELLFFQMLASKILRMRSVVCVHVEWKSVEVQASGSGRRMRMVFGLTRKWG